MAKRYIGDAVIRIQLSDANGNPYVGTVSAGGRVWHFKDLQAPAIGFGAGVAYDSSEAYDRMAASAVSFGSYYTTHNRPDDPNDDNLAGYPDAETADAISNATSWACDDQGNYSVRRSPNGPEVCRG